MFDSFNAYTHTRVYIYAFDDLQMYIRIYIYTLLNFDSDTYRCNNVTDKVNKRIIQ